MGCRAQRISRCAFSHQLIFWLFWLHAINSRLDIFTTIFHFFFRTDGWTQDTKCVSSTWLDIYDRECWCEPIEAPHSAQFTRFNDDLNASILTISAVFWRFLLFIGGNLLALPFCLWTYWYLPYMAPWSLGRRWLTLFGTININTPTTELDARWDFSITEWGMITGITKWWRMNVSNHFE